MMSKGQVTESFQELKVNMNTRLKIAENACGLDMRAADTLLTKLA